MIILSNKNCMNLEKITFDINLNNKNPFFFFFLIVVLDKGVLGDENDEGNGDGVVEFEVIVDDVKVEEFNGKGYFEDFVLRKCIFKF